MDDESPHRMSWPRVVARVAGYALFAVVLYLLSIGPASYLLLGRSERSDNALGAIYAPVLWLHHQTALNTVINPYILWWFHLPGGPDERILRQSAPLPASQEFSPAAPPP